MPLARPSALLLLPDQPPQRLPIGRQQLGHPLLVDFGDDDLTDFGLCGLCGKWTHGNNAIAIMRIRQLPAAVTHDALAGDVRGTFAAQPEHDIGHIEWLTDPAERGCRIE